MPVLSTLVRLARTLLRPGSSRAGRVRGSFDVVRHGMATGWAYGRARPAERLEVEIRLDGQAVGRGLADKFRGDLVSAESDGRCGFAIPLTTPLPADVEAGRITARVVGTSREIGKAATFAIENPREAGHFEGVAGWTAIGWAAEPASHDPIEVELLIGGDVVATAIARSFREDVRANGFGDGHAGFNLELPVRPKPGETLQVEARFKRSGEPLPGSPRPYRIPPVVADWLGRHARGTGPARDRLRRRRNAAVAGRTLSIVMPVYDTRDDWLRGAIESVLAQDCDAWELVCIDDASPDARVRDTLAEFARRDPRIRAISLDRNLGIAGATSAGIRESAGEFVAFLDHDDALEPEAVYETLRAAGPETDLVYSDEILTGEDIGDLRSLVARPAFSYDYYLSHPYFVHFVAVRRTLALDVGGCDGAMSISADVDFMLRIIERARAVTHVPLPLYRWRTHPGSAGHARKAAVTEATTGALQRHLDRLPVVATASPGLGFNFHRVDFADDHGVVAIVIPTKNKADLLSACIASIEATTDPDEVRIVVVDHDSNEPGAIAYLAEIAERHRVLPYSGPFNFAAINNHAVREAAQDARYLLFMNNDVEVAGSGWLGRMRSLAGRADVGVVGATLIYPDRRIQHAGVILGLQSCAEHSHKFADLMIGDQRQLGANGSLLSVRDYAAVTAACMMIRRELFDELGGFDEGLAIGFNDTDLCLRAGAAGLKVLNDAHVVFVHRESATRARTSDIYHPEDTQRFRTRWRDLLRSGDPFYNPVFSLEGTDHTLADRVTRHPRPRTRPVILPGSRPATPGETESGTGG